MTTFSPVIAPSYSSSQKKTFRTLRADFGDGYSLKVADGIKTERQVWSLSWGNLTNAQATTITDFFDTQGEHIPFTWVTPYGETKRFYISGGYTKTPVNYNASDLSVMFEEDLNQQ